ncbi:PilZ domain-containing protein [Desulfosarcina sp.]|uniref:PilZ domain-containing protein n=1 Tax=Desulfosarcina sp. TaxID=2027861 RepID=UPI0029A6AA6B|nr:PilZ domain-containing protein [Desulfosarcina sp.]MDX2452915.1 PilZ domain-containing protein [Desulfosarcina sp.]MDX2490649.1 PilZ domain-containing protein [Desulfosarcina sp.]
MEAEYNLKRSRRINERKYFQKEVLFSTGSIFFLGKINNISKDGASVGIRNIPKLNPGIEIFIAIPFPKKQGSIKVKAIVMWANMDQFGVKFNKRANVRKYYQREVILSTGSIVFPGMIQNISMGGAQIGSRNLSISKTPVVINVSIPFAKKQGSIKRKAIVRWAQNDQFGIQFI